jgi:hypothetical protein
MGTDDQANEPGAKISDQSQSTKFAHYARYVAVIMLLQTRNVGKIMLSFISELQHH